MRILRCVVAFLAVVAVLEAGPVYAVEQPQVPPQDEFVPIDELPPQDQLPAAPLLVTAYVIVLAVFFVYLVSLARRMSAIQRDMRELESSLGRSRRE